MSEPNRKVVTGGRSWPTRYTYVPALRVGNFLFISGTMATDDNNQIVGRGDIVAQTRHIFGKFEQLLASIGATCADIVQTTDYITTTESYKATAQVRREIFGDDFPTATGIMVAGLLREGALIEISAIAALSDDPD